MRKREIDIRDYAGDIIRALRTGILITTKVGDKVNSMTIGWGTLGLIWEKPFFVAYVRHQRYTREMLDQCQEFTVNVPVGDEKFKKCHDCELLRFCRGCPAVAYGYTHDFYAADPQCWKNS